MRVRDCINADVVTVREDASLRELQALFRRYDVSVVPVVGRDPEGRMRRLLGVVTRGELLRVLLAAKTVRALEARWARPVSSIARNVGALRPQDSVAEALDRFSRAGVPAMPVLDDGRLAGIVSISDVLARLAPDRAVLNSP